MKIIDTIKIAICSNENLSLEKRVDCIEYINNLQQENKELKERINTYENPEDLTLFYMWLDEKAKDKIKELKDRINKAIAYIEKYKQVYDIDGSVEPKLDEFSILASPKYLIDLLKGDK